MSSDAAENQTSLFLANKATKLGHVTKFLDTDWFSNKSKQRKITEKVSRTEAAPSFSLAQLERLARDLAKISANDSNY